MPPEPTRRRSRRCRAATPARSTATCARGPTAARHRNSSPRRSRRRRSPSADSATKDRAPHSPGSTPSPPISCAPTTGAKTSNDGPENVSASRCARPSSRMTRTRPSSSSTTPRYPAIRPFFFTRRRCQRRNRPRPSRCVSSREPCAAPTSCGAIALATLRAGFPAGTPANATKTAVDAATTAAFDETPCRGLEYAGEQARLVHAGVQPPSMLMPGVR